VCLLLPGNISDLEDLDKFEEFAFIGKNIRLTGNAAVTPPLVTPFSGRRWLEEYEAPPRSKSTQNKLRSTYLDAVIAVLRSLSDAALTSVLSFGEGGLVAAGLLSPEVRQAAYKERRVAELEASPLEAMAAVLDHVVLVAPHSYPHKSYLSLLREYVPELCSITPALTISVHVVSPSRDPLGSIATSIASGIVGSILETVAFDGPAYPSKPRTLYQ
jgi:hypothetical protein